MLALLRLLILLLLAVAQLDARGAAGGRGKSFGGMDRAGNFDEDGIKNPYENISLLQFVNQGQFEKDLWAYCSNRVSFYSCLYWFHPENLESAWRNPDEVSLSKKQLALRTNGTLQFVFDPHAPRIEMAKHIAIMCFSVIGCLVNTIAFINFKMIASNGLPLFYYLVYISILESILTLFKVVDSVYGILTNTSLFMTLQNLNITSCKLISPSFSLVFHLIQALYIGLAIDTWVFVNKPIETISYYSFEFVKNVFIVCFVICAILNCQYFWTQDFVKLEYRFPQAGKSSECGYGQDQKWTKFQSVVWPMLDHALGEVLPCVLCLVLGLLCYQIGRRKMRTLKQPVGGKKDPKRFWLNETMVLENMTLLPALLILKGIFSILPTAFVMIKYFSDISRLLMRRDYSAVGNVETQSTDRYLDLKFHHTEIYIRIFEVVVQIVDSLWNCLRLAFLLHGSAMFREQTKQILISVGCAAKRRDSSEKKQLLSDKTPQNGTTPQRLKKRKHRPTNASKPRVPFADRDVHIPNFGFDPISDEV
ncbi:hypothetical protein Ciccas_009570 [Cichlidogyrus casuarinus]|uniref:Uncharacterized protein n=1 Tax=Cichlidogyrus casuarinus TaxID=1844966 RepID=A0ABD2PZE3_9PLAT